MERTFFLFALALLFVLLMGFLFSAPEMPFLEGEVARKRPTAYEGGWASHGPIGFGGGWVGIAERAGGWAGCSFPALNVVPRGPRRHFALCPSWAARNGPLLPRWRCVWTSRFSAVVIRCV